MCSSVHCRSISTFTSHSMPLTVCPHWVTPLLSTILLLFIIAHFVNGDQIYQPVQSEIDRFKMIQEQIHLQQQQDQQQQQAQQHEHKQANPIEDGIMARRHPFLNHLINHLMGQQQQVQHQAPMVQESQLVGQQPMSPIAMAPTNHQPILQPQMNPQGPINEQQMAQMQSQHIQHSQPSSLQSAPNINPDSYRLLMNKNLAFPGENPADLDSKLLLGGEQNNHDTKTEDGILDFSESHRDDKHHQNKHREVSLHGPRRCYACSWSIAQCSDFNCYNNPDICTNNHFKSHRVHQADCPSGCEQLVITDPNGLITSWKRGCAPPSLPIKGFRCNTHYELGIRIDRCICNHDWCNWAHSMHQVSLWLLLFSITLSLLHSRLFH